MGGENAVFDAICKDGQPGVITNTDWQRAFNRLDRDRNGSITLEEWSAAVQAFDTVSGSKIRSSGSIRSSQSKGSTLNVAQARSARSGSPAVLRSESWRGSPLERAIDRSSGMDPEAPTQNDEEIQLRERLRLASEMIQRHEKVIQERQARIQRADWYYTNRISELRGQLHATQQEEGILQERTRANSLELQAAQTAHRKQIDEIDLLEQQLPKDFDPAREQRRVREAQLQRELDRAQQKNDRLSQQLVEKTALLQGRVVADAWPEDFECDDDSVYQEVVRNPSGGKRQLGKLLSF